MSVGRATIILCLLTSQAHAQASRYIVTFKDKNNSPYSISQPTAFLSAKSIARRAHSGFTVTTDDLPVTPSYVTDVRATGAKAFFTSRWFNAVLVEATSAQITAISGLSVVSNVELAAPGQKLLGGRVGRIRQKNTSAADGVTQSQLEMLGLDKMHADGYTGSGIMVGIMDAGFPGVNVAPAFAPVLASGQIRMTKDFVTNSGNVYQFNQHGTQVFSVIAGQLQGAFTGGAYNADYLLFVTEDTSSEYRVEEYNWLFAAEKADSAGADVIQSSLGYTDFDDPSMDYALSDIDGTTAVISRAAGFARDRGIIVVVSAGNLGSSSWHYITPPADVDGVLSVGAVNSAGNKTTFSSFGPTADGRTKPDVMALGQSTSVIFSSGAVGSASGTSLAAPLVTSLVIGLLQAHPELIPAEIVEIVRLSASNSQAPDNSFGFGVPNYVAVENYLRASQTSQDVMIYPNPVESTLQLVFKDLPEGTVSVSCYDVLGKLLANPSTELNWRNNPLEISVSSLAAGLYFLRIQTSAGVKTLRFIKI